MNSLRTLPTSQNASFLPSTPIFQQSGLPKDLKNLNKVLTSQTVLYLGNTGLASNIPFKTRFTKGCFPNVIPQWFTISITEDKLEGRNPALSYLHYYGAQCLHYDGAQCSHYYGAIRASFVSSYHMPYHYLLNPHYFHQQASSVSSICAECHPCPRMRR